MTAATLDQIAKLGLSQARLSAVVAMLADLTEICLARSLTLFTTRLDGAPGVSKAIGTTLQSISGIAVVSVSDELSRTERSKECSLLTSKCSQRLLFKTQRDAPHD